MRPAVRAGPAVICDEAFRSQPAMRASNQAQLWGALGVCLLSAPLGRWGWDHLALPPPSGSRPEDWPAGLPLNELAPAHSPSSQALREARQEWIRAEQAAA